MRGAAFHLDQGVIVGLKMTMTHRRLFVKQYHGSKITEQNVSTQLLCVYQYQRTQLAFNNCNSPPCTNTKHSLMVRAETVMSFPDEHPTDLHLPYTPTHTVLYKTVGLTNCRNKIVLKFLPKTASWPHRFKRIKGSKECYLLGQNATCKYLG